jgi:single-strand DNA-binding protein
MLNHITIMGRICNDIELRKTGSGVSVASFTVAVDRDFKSGGEKETDFIECVAWRQTGEFIQKHFAKGRMIVVSGRLQIRPWNDKEGNKRKTAEIVVDNAYFGDSKTSAAPAQNFAPIEEADEGLPF